MAVIKATHVTVKWTPVSSFSSGTVDSASPSFSELIRNIIIDKRDDRLLSSLLDFQSDMAVLAQKLWNNRSTRKCNS